MASGETRNLYRPIPDRLVIRTKDVHQIQNENGVDGYSDTLLSVVANYTNSGIPEGSNACGMAGKSKRGEVACQIFLTIRPDGALIEAAGFKCRGCIAITASASVICRMAENTSLAQALAITPEALIDVLDGVPDDKRDSPVFAVEALRAAIGDWLLKNRGMEALDEIAPCDEYSVNCLTCEHCSLRDLRVDYLIDQMTANA